MIKLALFGVFLITGAISAEEKSEIIVTTYFQSIIVNQHKTLSMVLEIDNKSEVSIKLDEFQKLEFKETLPTGVKFAPILEKKDEPILQEGVFYLTVVVRLHEEAFQRHAMLQNKETEDIEIPAKSSRLVKIILPQECFWETGIHKIQTFLTKGSDKKAVATSDETTITCVKNDEATSVKPNPRDSQKKEDTKP
jgi:hypothetical protein